MEGTVRRAARGRHGKHGDGERQTATEEEEVTGRKARAEESGRSRSPFLAACFFNWKSEESVAACFFNRKSEESVRRWASPTGWAPYGTGGGF